MSYSRDAFDPFTSDDWQENGQSTTESQQQADPWSSDTWGTSIDFHNTTLDTSFDSAALFDINPAPSSDVFSEVLNADDASSLFFPEFAGGEGLSTSSSRGEEEKAIQVAIHEQLSCLYDGKANSGHVDGSIHVSKIA
jgi:hypothetical protein